MHRFDLVSYNDGVAGIVEGSHSVSNLNYLSIDHILSIKGYQRVIPI